MDLGTCTPTLNCLTYTDSTSCEQEASCDWIPSGTCGSGGEAGTCAATLGAGDVCDPYQSGVCGASYCSFDNTAQEYRCEVELDTSSCLRKNDALMLHFTFLFGVVWVSRRLRRRKARATQA